MPEHRPADPGTVYRGLTIAQRQLLDQIVIRTASLRDQIRSLNQHAKLGGQPHDIAAVRARLFDPGPTPTT
jgi:hypothetical protein